MPVVLAPSVGSGLTEVILDPSEVAEDRTELALNAGPIAVQQEGLDWGDAAIQAYVAEQAVGQSPIDFRLPNREIKIPLILGADGSAGFATARRNLQAKVARFQQEGGWLKRGTDTYAGVVYADIVNATLTLPDRLNWLGVEADVILTLEVLPDFYGDEETLSIHSGNGWLIFTEDDIKGDYPGRLRLDVTDTSGKDQLGLVAALRSRHYSADATAALFYQAEDLTPLDGAAVGADSSASGNSRVAHTNLLTAWTPVLSTEVDGVGQMSHVGSYRVRARMLSIDGSNVQVRLVSDVGDFKNPVENSSWEFPSASAWFQVDLGTVRLDKVPVGDHSWQGVIQAKGAAGGESVRIDTLELEPLDEGWEKLSAPITGKGSFTVSASDTFDSLAPAAGLNGRTSDSGDVWASSAISGSAATDWKGVVNPDGSGDIVVYNDAISTTGLRFARIPTNFTQVKVGGQVRFSYSAPTNASAHVRLITRYVDASNYLRLQNAVYGVPIIEVVERVAGVDTVLAAKVMPNLPNVWLDVSLATYIDGTYRAEVGIGGRVLWTLTGQSNNLKTGGALQTGEAGFAHSNTGTTASTYYVNNVYVLDVDTHDAVMYGSQSAQLRFDGNFREDAAGDFYGAAPIAVGDLLRIPPSGLEGRPVEFYLKPSRGDFDTVPDSSRNDGLTAQAYYRPSYLFLPSS